MGENLGVDLLPSRWLDLGGPVHFVDFGGPPDAPLLICVHGLGGSHLNWTLIAPQLTRQYRVLALDLPAHGRTPAAGRSTAMDDLQHLLDGFLARAAGGAPVVLIGNSMGAAVSVLQAARRPRTVAALALIDPAVPHTPLDRPDPLVLLAFAGYQFPRVAAAFGRRRRPPTVEDVVRQILDLCCAHPERVPEDVVQAGVALALEQQRDPGTAVGFTQAARSLVRMLARPARYRRALRSLTQPVLVLHGARDRLIPVAAARRLATRSPGWQLHIHPDAGHVPQLEAPDWVLARLGPWLAGLALSAAQPAAAPLIQPSAAPLIRPSAAPPAQPAEPLGDGRVNSRSTASASGGSTSTSTSSPA